MKVPVELTEFTEFTESGIESIQVLRVNPEAVLPTRAHPDDAGLDLYSLDDTLLPPGQGKVVKTGIALALPLRHVGMIADRSSLAKKGIKTAGGIIDAGYRGEIQVVLWNLSGDPIQLKRGERIAQLLIIPIATPKVHEVIGLDDTSRGTKGFGSSGK
jgi:dUTP pyrophosphatase